MNTRAAGQAAHTARTGPSAAATTRLTNDPNFQELVGKRNSLALMLSIIMMAIYLGFIFLVAFDKPLLATKVMGGTTSLGIVLGLVVIVAAIVLTGLYVARANGRFDELTAKLTREHGR
ncbi:MAG: DUF485 domain-containing protein [Janthinobacterium lividum]